MNGQIRCATTLLLLFGAATVWALEIARSDWDDGTAQGWVLTNSAAGTYSLQQGGGNPGGWIKFVDASGNTQGFISAPASFHGNYLAIDGALQFEFDLRILQPFTVGSFGPVIVMSGPGGSARFTDTSQPTEAWRHYTVILEPGFWTVQSGTWEGLLANVTDVSLNTDTLDGLGDDSGLDNFALVAVQEAARVPAAPTVAILVLAAALLWSGRRSASAFSSG